MLIALSSPPHVGAIALQAADAIVMETALLRDLHVRPTDRIEESFRGSTVGAERHRGGAGARGGVRGRGAGDAATAPGVPRGTSAHGDFVAPRIGGPLAR